MKKIYLLLLLVAQLFPNSKEIYSQNFDKLPQMRRDSLLIAIADRAVEKYGPEYNRGYLTPVVNFEGEYKQGAFKGKTLYTVTYPYDRSKEIMNESFSAKVYILNETGKAVFIHFGNSFMYHIEKLEREGIEVSKMPFSTVKKQEIYKL